MIDAVEGTKIQSEIRYEPLRGVRFMKLREGLCKFPLGRHYDPPERFCGDPTLVGSPYCPKCQRIAYTRTAPVSKKRPDVRTNPDLGAVLARVDQGQAPV